MAGIGEASAIIAVAQAGISLSMVIIAYVGDVRDAPKSVSRIGNEIKSTSGRLEEIAEIIRDNPSTRLLLDTAVGDATRCSSECELILAQVGNLLVKGGWKRNSTGLSKDDIDTSVVASLRWPFLKTRLDTPRAELQRIKADLILLFNVAMARKSSTPLTNEYAQKIPLLTKKKEDAARRAEEARHKARESQDHDYATRTRSPRASSRRVTQIAEEDPELSQHFWELELQRAKEQEDRKIQERAALLQVENDRKTKAEEDRQREIARKAVEDYKLQQEEIKAKTMAREKQLSDELLALGLGPEQVASILAVPSLNVDDIRSNIISRRKSTESQRTSLTEVARRPKPQRKRRGGFPIKFLPWGGNHSSKLSDSENNSVESKLQGNSSHQYKRGTDDEESIELWLVDVFSRQHTELAPSERWISQKLERIEKSNDVWHRFAQLQPMWRVAIQDFLKARNKAQRPEHAWKIIHIGLPRRMTKMSIFGHHHGGQLVRLIISRRKSANQAVKRVVVVKSEIDKTLPSTVRASTYLPRQLVSTSAIRESSFDYEETFEVASDDAASELREVTDETHVMIAEALTLKQVNRLASLTKSFMESGRVPWAAQPLFTFTVIEKEARYDDRERVYGHSDYGPGHPPGRLTPAHKFLENQQRGRRADRGPESPRELKSKVEGSIDYLKQRRSDIGEFPNPEDRVWLHEVDTMISVLRRRLAKLDPQTAKTNDYGHDDDHDGIPSRSHSKPYPALAARSSEEERLYREDDFQPRNVRLASVERSNMNRKPPRITSDGDSYIRSRLNASLAERGLQTVPEDDLDLYELVHETRNPGWVPPPPQPSPEWPRERLRENYRRGSSDSEGADKRSFERTRPTPREYDENTIQIKGKNGNKIVIENDRIQRDEKRVVSKDRQLPNHHTGYEEKAHSRDRNDREMIYQPRENVGKPMKKKEGHEHGRQTKTVDLTRPTYIKVHRKHLSPDTLDAYDLPWEWEKSDSQYIIIKCWIPEADQIILFEHTKKLRERKLLVDTKQKTRHYKEKSDLERPKRDMSFEREDTWPDGRNSQALVLREPRGRYSSHEHPSRKSTYDDGIRVRGYDSSPSPSPPLSPKLRPPTFSKSFGSWDEPRDKYAQFSHRPPKPFLSSRVTTQSRVQAPRSVKSSDEDEDDDDFHEIAKDDEADLIAETLSRYTTFKVDQDVTVGAKSSPPPAVDAPESPTISESRSTPPPGYPMTLEDMKSSLEKMQIKKSRAEEEGDIRTASDLHYYDIPEMQRRIKGKEDEARMRADAKAEKIESAGRAYGVQPSRTPVHPVVVSPITAEDGVAGAQDSSKKAENTLPQSRVQWHGIHDDPATEEQKDRSGKRKLKKMKSADDLRIDDLADPSFRPAGSANHAQDHANQNTRSEKTEEDNSLTSRLRNETPSSTNHNTRSANQSPSQSESEREQAVRRADTQLYEADSEGSGREERTFERRGTWRRPTVEDEGVEEEEEEED